jgi:hypothetical protein
MDNQIIINDGLDIVTKNVTFTQSQWLAFVAAVNNEVSTALLYGLIIGAAAASAGIFLAQWYNGRKR